MKLELGLNHLSKNIGFLVTKLGFKPGSNDAKASVLSTTFAADTLQKQYYYNGYGSATFASEGWQSFLAPGCFLYHPPPWAVQEENPNYHT